MEDEKKARRVKNVNATAHRSGTLRGAAKPQSRTSESGVQRLISTYLASAKVGTLQQTTWGDALSKYATALRSSFGLAANDTPYLLCDVSGNRKAGVLLSTTGIHIADGHGGSATITWKDLPKTQISSARGMLTIGSVRIVTSDAQALAGLLRHLQQNANA